ncbi:hypothetical protein HNQ94_001103 [Salirhabdus euzebyi]|uniref:Uncharacterized protein n=1 Tax=Salirhabdus euzebyi TaxID=394506 RepID=A0A841PUH7_9BACI|nr:hypothetical protein [Salirhabdus euzebyi]MBB6452657.1 hypothetical protein [Salirhabdus euzebyi]
MHSGKKSKLKNKLFKKLVFMLCGLLVLLILTVFYIEYQTEKELEKEEFKLMHIQSLNKQIVLTHEKIVKYSHTNAPEEEIIFYVQSLQHMFQIFHQSAVKQNFVNTRWFSDVHNNYWSYSAFVFRNNFSEIFMVKAAKHKSELLDMEDSLQNKVNQLKEKIANYWWK